MRRVGTFVLDVGTCAVEICHLSFFYYGKTYYFLCVISLQIVWNSVSDSGYL